MQYYWIVIQKYATKKILIEKYVTNMTSIQNMFQYLADIFGVKKYIFLHFKQYFLIGFDYGNNCNQHISRIYQKNESLEFGCDMTMLVISANMCFCVQYRKCALFGNASQPLRGNCISPFHPTLFQRGQQKSHFERAGLFSTVHFQIYLHCFNGGSKSHISREASKSHH